VPDGMSSQVHEFDAREGGSFRVSLTYDAPTSTGKSAAHADTGHGRFTRLVPDEQVTEVFEFESADPGLAGKMTMTTMLAEADGGGGGTPGSLAAAGLAGRPGFCISGSGPGRGR
jgi:uncharacterized protein YndB with AHSA1/START domain